MNPSKLEIHRRIPTRRAPKMRGRPLKQTLPDIRLAQQQLNILLRPLARRQRLEKHHNLLKVHLDQFIGPLDQERRAHVQVEFGEALFFSLEEGRLVL